MIGTNLTANGTASASQQSKALRSVIVATIGSSALLSAMYMTGAAPAAAHAATTQEQGQVAATPCRENLISVGYLA